MVNNHHNQKQILSALQIVDRNMCESSMKFVCHILDVALHRISHYTLPRHVWILKSLSSQLSICRRLPLIIRSDAVMRPLTIGWPTCTYNDSIQGDITRANKERIGLIQYFKSTYNATNNLQDGTILSTDFLLPESLTVIAFSAQNNSTTGSKSTISNE